MPHVESAYAASGIALRCGMLVELSGQFSAYVAKGRMQFTVRSLALAGEGRLRMQVAELARKLETEGLMRPIASACRPDTPTASLLSLRRGARRSTTSSAR